jgi:hypothetical protein
MNGRTLVGNIHFTYLYLGLSTRRKKVLNDNR